MISDELKKRYNDKLYSSNLISVINKPSRRCGSTSLILNYIYNRMIYEDLYTIVITAPSSNSMNSLINSTLEKISKLSGFSSRGKKFFEVGTNRIIISSESALSSLRGYSINEIIMTDSTFVSAQQIYNNEFFADLVSILSATKGRILVENDRSL